jgi:hypothetical protein
MFLPNQDYEKNLTYIICTKLQMIGTFIFREDNF